MVERTSNEASARLHRRSFAKAVASSFITAPTIFGACTPDNAANINAAPGTKVRQDGKNPKNPNSWPTESRDQRELFEFYGDPTDDKTLVKVKLPERMRIAEMPGQYRYHLWAHHKVADSVATIIERVYAVYDRSSRRHLGLDVFGGDHVDRPMRGAKRWSLHAWGIAFDFDPGRNRYRWNHRRARMAGPEFEDWWNIWEQEGWYSLGRHHDFDWMHVQAALRRPSAQKTG